MKRFSRLRWAGLAVAIALVATASWAGYPFSDGGESGAGQWSAAAPWALTTATAHSGSYAFTDSPGTTYANGVDLSLAQAATMDLLTAVRPRLSFWHKYALENGYDYGLVEISLDGGSSWLLTPLASYTGGSDWRREEIDLSGYAGQPTVRLRFRLTSDATVTQDGWYLDDIRVDEGPAAVTLSAITVRTANTLQLGWSASGDADFATYRIVRGLTAGFDWRTAYTVTTLSTVESLTYTDIALSPKTTYRYRVVVTDTQGFESPSNEVSGTTLAGMDFPFLDNGEGGTATWVADPPWGLSAEAALSGVSAWSDSPGGNYADNLSGTSLTLSAPLNLSTSATPVLSFWHTYAFPGNDHGIVEVSVNGGLNWTQLRDFTNGTLASWGHVQVDLSAYKALAVLVRFRVTTDGATQGDGWHLDDIAVAEQPAVVIAPTLSNVTSHSIDLAWLANAEPNFGAYAIHYATATGVTLDSPLAASIPLQSTTSYSHTGLALNTPYYYRVYAVNRWGVYGPDSPTEGYAQTLNNPLPFSDGFEGALDNWVTTGGWSKSNLVTAHGGAWCLQDSPGSYANSTDTYAVTSLDLTGAVNPILSFWDLYAFQTDADWGLLEYSTNGSSWGRFYTVSGTRSTWARQQIDLTDWRGQPNFRIRFRVVTDGGTVGDGWYIDDISVAESALPTLTLPLSEGFESGTSQWLVSKWALSADAPHGGAACILSSPGMRIYPDSWSAFRLNGALDLRGSTNPQLTFWARGHMLWCSYFRVYASINGGQTWTQIGGWNHDWNPDTVWQRVQVDLTAYKDTANLRLSINVDTVWCGADEDIYLDDIRIAEAPAAVALDTPTPHLKTVDVSWSASGLGAEFWKYEVYRSTSADVNLGSTLLATLTSSGTTTFTDTNPPEGLSIGQTYFYRVYTYDTYGTVVGSNIRSTTTVSLSLPVADPMENLTNWVRGGTGTAWGVTAVAPHDGAGSITESPSGDYANNSDTWIMTAVNLTAAVNPVLSFWDSYSFQPDADWGILEYSTDGGSWGRFYAVNGTRSAWARQQIDLTPWRGQANFRIRFRVSTNGDGITADGWAIDDLTVAEVSLPTFTLPFTEDFESGTTQWFVSKWATSTDTPHGGTTSVLSSPGMRIYPDSWSAVRLNGQIDLTGSTNPQLTFWARGHMLWCSYFRVYASTDGGFTWVNFAGWNHDWNPDTIWQRVQVDLTAYKNATNLRLSFEMSCAWCGGDEDVYLDDIRVAETPAAVTLDTPTPHLKTVDVSWSASGLGADFWKYEVYRSTSADVNLGSTLLAALTASGTTAFTDTNPPEGLSIGQTYFYRIYTYDKFGTTVGSNIRSTTTVSLPLPVADPMENLANWVRGGTGTAWGVTAVAPHGGAAAITESPSGDYANNSDTWIMTAVNLTAAVNPVLTFWDRYSFQPDADWGIAEYSTDGNSWARFYAVSGTRAAWARQQIDLTQWRGQANFRIRFRVATNNDGITSDGWAIDDLTVAEASLPTFTLPFSEDFDSGTSRWFLSKWATDTDTPRSGSTCVLSSPGMRLYPDSSSPLRLAGQIDLTGTTNPQLTFWARGHMLWCSYFRVYVSTDGGATWADTGGGWNHDWNPNTVWQRVQVDLTAYKNAANLRLSFDMSCAWCGADEDVYLDDIRIAELPPAVTLNPISPITTSTLQLSWTQYAGSAFLKYMLYRSNAANVTMNDTLFLTATDPASVQFVDTGLQLGRTYYYRLFTQDLYGAITPTNTVYARTATLSLPMSDNLESVTDYWTNTGTWQRQTGAGRGGGTALVDSVGNYNCSMDQTATFAVNLATAEWPVLTFWDRYDYETNTDWGAVEILTGEGAGWIRRYSVTGMRTDWRQIQIDLSEWKGNSNVWIRFHSWSNGCGVQGDGWTLDDISVTENGHAALPYPYVNGLESGTGDLFPDRWQATTSSPKDGTQALVNAPGVRMYGDTAHVVNLSGSLDLTGATSPALTYWLRGHMYWCSYFHFQASTDGGLTWADLPGTYVSHDFTPNQTWQKFTTSLSAYKVANLRLRFYINTAWCGADAELLLDAIRIGEPTPTAPTPTLPADGATVSVLRPSLTVANAYDVQFDNLTYRFEIYSDAALTQLVAQVPSVAETTTTTSWAVDSDLGNNAQYWWRCRASDGTNTGPWSSTTTFFVVQVNNPPTVPAAVSPNNGASLWGVDAPIIWYPSTDPNAGDTVTYDLQIDNSPAFTSPEVSEVGIDENHGFAYRPEASTLTVTLGSLTGYASLQNLTVYYWRLRAVDNRGAASSWTTESRYFLFGNDVQAPLAAWSAPANGSTITTTPVSFTGTASDDFSGLDYVQVSVDGGATWQLASGAGSWSFSYAPVQNGDLAVLVRAADKAGNLSTPSLRSFVVALPNIPVQLQAFPDNTTVTLTWVPPALTGVTGYNIYRSLTSRSGYVMLNVSPVAMPVYRDANLANGTAYFYAVTALYGATESPYSDEAWAVTPATGRPPFVDDLLVRRSGADLVLSWTPVTTDTGGGPYACPSYEVYDGATGNYTADVLGNSNRLAIVTGETTMTVTGAATDGQRHHYHVTAADAGGVEGFWTEWFAEENGRAVTKTADWAAQANAYASGGSCLTSTTINGEVTLSFTGTGAGLSAKVGPDQGIAQILLDGAPVASVDLYSAQPGWRQWVWGGDGFADTAHTVVVLVTGTKNASSSGTEVTVDRFVYGR